RRAADHAGLPHRHRRSRPPHPSDARHGPRDLWAIGPPSDGTRRRHLLDRWPATAPTPAAARSRRAIARTGPRRSLQLGGSARSATPSRPAPRRHRGHRPRDSRRGRVATWPGAVRRMTSLICGFGDVAAGLGGLAWDLNEPGAVLLSGGEAHAGTFAIEEGGDAVTLEITAGVGTVEAALSSRTTESALDGGPIATICVAEARAVGGAPT